MVELICNDCNLLFDAAQRRAKGKVAHCDSCKAPKLCTCGCGSLTKSGKYNYCAGHNPHVIQVECVTCGTKLKTGIRATHKEHKCFDCASFPCACGCGERIVATQWRPNKRFKKGHHPSYHKVNCLGCKKELEVGARVKYYEHLCFDCGFRLCACGCGEKLKPTYWNYKPKYKQGHQPPSRSTGPTYIELMLFNALDKRSFKLTAQGGYQQYKLPALVKPDILCPVAGLIIMADGCYWHECPKHGWGTKRNQRVVDKRITKVATAAGWTILRFWEHEIYNDLDRVVTTINATRLQLLRAA